MRPCAAISPEVHTGIAACAGSTSMAIRDAAATRDDPRRKRGEAEEAVTGPARGRAAWRWTSRRKPTTLPSPSATAAILPCSDGTTPALISERVHSHREDDSPSVIRLADSRRSRDAGEPHRPAVGELRPAARLRDAARGVCIPMIGSPHCPPGRSSRSYFQRQFARPSQMQTLSSSPGVHVPMPVRHEQISALSQVGRSTQPLGTGGSPGASMQTPPGGFRQPQSA